MTTAAKTTLLYTLVESKEQWDALLNRDLSRWYVDEHCRIAATEAMADAADDDIYSTWGWNAEPQSYPVLAHVELRGRQAEIADAMLSGQVIREGEPCPNCGQTNPIDGCDEGDCTGEGCGVHLYCV